MGGEVRKRKPSPLGPARPVRTIPIPIAPRNADAGAPPRRPLVPLEPRLATMVTDLRPPSTGGAPAAWSSWATADHDEELVLGPWETPLVDGEPATGHGVGFARPEVVPGPIALETAGPRVAASDAGWAPAPAPAPTGSWVGPVAQLGTVPAAPDAAPDPAYAAAAMPVAPVAPGPDPAVATAMARHPSAAAGPAPVVAPPPIAVRPASVDPEDFTLRLGRGAAFATTEQQLLTLAERALQRLAPHGRSRWLVSHPDGSLTLRFATGQAVGIGCAVAESSQCPAIASGRARRFERSDDLDACPQLLAAGGPSCAVVCVPVRGNGPLRGVLQTSVPAAAPLDLVTAALLDRTAQTLAGRITELRHELDGDDADAVDE